MNITPELRNAIIMYRGGDADSFNLMYENSKNYIFNCIYKVVCTNANAYEVASEIFNDTFMEISQSVYQLKDVEKYLSWAGTIATRKCFDYIKKNNYYEYETDLEEDYPDDNLIPEAVMQSREKQLMVKQIIDTNLSEMQKLCIVAYYYNDMKQSDIANQLGIPENSVKTHLSRAKHRIKDAVIDIEKNEGTRLYNIAPFMLLMLGTELEGYGDIAAAAVATGAANEMLKGIAFGNNIVSAGEGVVQSNIMAASGNGAVPENVMATSGKGAVPENVMAASGNGAVPENVMAASGKGAVSENVMTASRKGVAAKSVGGMAMKTKGLIAMIAILCIGAIAGIVMVVTKKDKDDSKDKNEAKKTEEMADDEDDKNTSDKETTDNSDDKTTAENSTADSNSEADTTENDTAESTTEQSTGAVEVNYLYDFDEDDRENLNSHSNDVAEAISSDYLGDLYDYKFVFDGVELAVPMDYKEFVDKLIEKGWEYKFDDIETKTVTTSEERPETLKVTLIKKIDHTEHDCFLYVTNDKFTPDSVDENGEFTYGFEDVDHFHVVGFSCTNYSGKLIEDKSYMDFYVTDEIGIGRSMSHVSEAVTPFHFEELTNNLVVSDIYNDSEGFVAMRSPEDKRYYKRYGERQDALSMLNEVIPFCSRYIFFYPGKASDDGIIISCIYIYNDPYLAAFEEID